MLRLAQRRLRTAVLLVLSLLFSQLALASYVCATATGQAQAVMEMAPGEPCEGMAADQEQPVLCHQHCTDAPQSTDAVKLLVLSAPAIVQVLTLPLAADSAGREALRCAHGHSPPPPSPVFLSTLRLRV